MYTAVFDVADAASFPFTRESTSRFSLATDASICQRVEAAARPACRAATNPPALPTAMPPATR